MQRVLTLILLVSALLSTPMVRAEPDDSAYRIEPTPQQRPVVALVLGGGGAKGAAHVGVLKALEEMHIPVDIVVGTSAGAAVGALYAMGKSAGEVQEIFIRTDWGKGFTDETPRPDLSIRRKQDQTQFAIDLDLGYRDGRFLLPRGFIQGQRLQLALNDITIEAATIEDFDRLPLRYRAIASNLETGEEVVLSKGNLARAIRASMSVPAIYAPVEIDGKMLIDGGLVNNIPISVARAMGADVVIAVDLTTPLRTKEEIVTGLDVLSQLSDFMTGMNSATQVSTLTDADILIKPELGDIGSASFERVDETIEIGATATRQMAVKLSHLSVSEAEFAVYQKRRDRLSDNEPIVQQIKLINHSLIDDEIILARIRQQAHEPIHVGRLEDDLGRVYGLGYFEAVTYRIETEPDTSKTLVIEARGKSWGPTYIRFGIEVEDNFKDNSQYGLSTSVLVTGINRLGAEWTNTVEVGSNPAIYTEFYQPLNYDSPFFSRTYAGFDRRTTGDFTESNTVATYDIDEYNAGTEMGRQLGTHADVALGIMRGTGSTKIAIGPPDIPKDNFDSGAYYARFYYDRLDDQFFPRSGQFGDVTYSLSRSEVGADSDFDRFIVNGLSAHSIGPFSVNISLRGSFLTKNSVEAQDSSSLGGFLNLSGYSKDELTGQEAVIGVLRMYYRMGTSVEWYLGGSLEAGNVYNKREDITLDSTINAQSIFVAMATFLGPVSLAFGHADSKHESVYLNIGKVF